MKVYESRSHTSLMFLFYCRIVFYSLGCFPAYNLHKSKVIGKENWSSSNKKQQWAPKAKQLSSLAWYFGSGWGGSGRGGGEEGSGRGGSGEGGGSGRGGAMRSKAVELSSWIFRAGGHGPLVLELTSKGSTTRRGTSSNMTNNKKKFITTIGQTSHSQQPTSDSHKTLSIYKIKSNYSPQLPPAAPAQDQPT